MNVIDLENRVATLEAFVGDVMRSQTFTASGQVQADGSRKDAPRRTPLGNRAAVILGLPEHPTNGGLDTSLDSVS